MNRNFMKKYRDRYSGICTGAGWAFLLLILLTGCGNKEAEFLTGELQTVQPTEPTEKETNQSVEEQPQITDVPATVFVDVCGAVVNPGVYELEADSRVFQAIEAAGGFLEEAAAEYINRAMILNDGQQVYIPTQEEVEKQEMPALSIQSNEQGEDKPKVNLNTAGKEELMTLTGIGESKADAILSYREENGGFAVKEDILNVRGIKEGTYEKIKEDIVVE